MPRKPPRISGKYFDGLTGAGIIAFGSKKIVEVPLFKFRRIK